MSKKDDELLERIRTAWIMADRAAEKMEELNVEPDRWRAVVLGDRKPNDEDLAYIAEACGVTVQWIKGK